jgi:hypothetical protein
MTFYGYGGTMWEGHVSVFATFRQHAQHALPSQTGAAASFDLNTLHRS